MKRQLLFAAVGIALMAPAVNSQDSPAAAAAREEAEARYQRLTSRIDDLEVTFHRFQRDLDKLESEIRSLRDQVSRVADNSQNAATQESIKRLADKIEEVDSKRLKDQESVMAGFREMERLLKSSISRSSPPKSTPLPDKEKNTGKGYEYTIREKDTLSGIVTAIREQKGLKVTQKQIMDANPGVNWNRLRIGQKIFIPEPSQP
ncbi:MAG: LysM peptidoglycan-binding domain-containing protein [Verrucomicrobia subdivision 3 bacterium]|nr:LysM peptidoglycan-binding domain-containing protein [Limisphaerales bacterium]